MHAHNCTEADQTDSIAVCAPKEEWREVLENLEYLDDYEMLTDAARDLRAHLHSMGIK